MSTARAPVSRDEWQTEVYTLIGHAEGLYAEGKRDMPAWCYRLAEKIAVTHLGLHEAERVRALAAQALDGATARAPLKR